MIKKTEVFIGLIFIIFISFFIITGCGKKEEGGEVQKPETSKSSAVDTTNQMSAVPEASIADITGNWSGIFDQRSATMSVIKQTGRDFSATMTINYRQPLTKTVNGTIDPENRTVKMEDLIESRYSGRYSGQLSENGKQIKGSFVLNSNGKSYGFNFKMK